MLTTSIIRKTRRTYPPSRASMATNVRVTAVRLAAGTRLPTKRRARSRSDSQYAALANVSATAARIEKNGPRRVQRGVEQLGSRRCATNPTRECPQDVRLAAVRVSSGAIELLRRRRQTAERRLDLIECHG